MQSTFVCDVVRSPFGRRGGSLAGVHPAELLSDSFQGLLARGHGWLSQPDVDEVVVGCVQQVGEQASNVARTAWLWGGLPVEVPAVTVDRQCTSGQQAAIFADALIRAGLADVVIAGGVESLSRIPMRASYAEGPGERYPAEFRSRYAVPPQGEAAERIADKWGVSREDADFFALESQRRARAAATAGVIERQILPVNGSHGVVREDEGLRDTSLKALAGLEPVFRREGVHTAGNSSQLTDGAAAAVLVSGDVVHRFGLDPLLEIGDSVAVASDPVLMLTGIIPATSKLLARNGLGVADISAFEVNEAFAAIVLAWQQVHEVPSDKINPLGGAISYGHPLGATGIRLIGSLAGYLQSGQRGIVTICGGGGVATATLFRRIQAQCGAMLRSDTTGVDAARQ